MTLNQEDYQKIVSEFKRKVGSYLSKTFNMYGMGDYIPHSTDKIVGYFEQSIKDVCKIMQRKQK